MMVFLFSCFSLSLPIPLDRILMDGYMSTSNGLRYKFNRIKLELGFKAHDGGVIYSIVSIYINYTV